MRRRALICLIILCLSLVGTAQPAFTAPEEGQEADAWQEVTPGIDYQQFVAPGPNNVFVARMDRANPNLTLDSMSAYGRLSGGRETISRMAQHYDQAINYWGENWGNRSNVIVAINGDFEIPDLAVPARGQVQSGAYAKRFTDKQNGSGFAWTLDRNAFVGECIAHPVGRQTLFLADGTQLEFQGINVPRGDEQIILYTSQFDSTTETNNSGVEVVVELPHPLMLPAATQQMVGTVTNIRKSQGSTPIPFDAVVISASGKYATQLSNHVQPGDSVRIRQEIRNFSEKDCTTLIYDFSWERTYASIGGSFYFLKNSKLQHLTDSGADIRNPRTAVAFNDQYLFFIVVDGRNYSNDSNPGVSVGMTMEELGRFARDTLGATYGINQDGGGSSEMVVNGVVVNTPSDGLQHATAVESSPYQLFLPMVGKGNQGDTWTPPSGSGPKVERAVVNGLMMVVVEPKEQSARFAPGDLVTTLANTSLRLGPGANYASLASLSPGMAGTVQPHSLNGVLAKGSPNDSYWWKVDFGGAVGWAPEDALSR